MRLKYTGFVLVRQTHEVITGVFGPFPDYDDAENFMRKIAEFPLRREPDSLGWFDADDEHFEIHQTRKPVR